MVVFYLDVNHINHNNKCSKELEGKTYVHLEGPLDPNTGHSEFRTNDYVVRSEIWCSHHLLDNLRSVHPWSCFCRKRFQNQAKNLNGE